MMPFVSDRIYRYLADDHERIDDALRRATSRPETIEPDAYAEFRARLLRHIGLEEKILLPAARAARGGEPLPVASKLRLDHGALTALLVPTPTPAIVTVIRAILERHNLLEESPGGVYEQCEQLVGAEADEILKRLVTAPAVKVLPHVDNPFVMESARRALKRAGYDLTL
jgi:Hemerythrin HHE cation binding domain